MNDKPSRASGLLACVSPTVIMETLACIRLEMALVDCFGQILEMYKIGYQSSRKILSNIQIMLLDLSVCWRKLKAYCKVV